MGIREVWRKKVGGIGWMSWEGLVGIDVRKLS